MVLSLPCFDPCSPGISTSAATGFKASVFSEEFRSLFSWNQHVGLEARKLDFANTVLGLFRSLFSWNQHVGSEHRDWLVLRKGVSILVLLESARRPPPSPFTSANDDCFDPCSPGISTSAT